MTEIEFLSKTLNLPSRQIIGTIELLDEGSTIPFIARYRKERTGSLDEVQIERIKNDLIRFREVVKRKVNILSTIEEQGALTPDLKSKIENCFDPIELEDLYLPFKPKRKTRATIAKENGLEPLAEIILKQTEKDIDSQIEKYISDKIQNEEEAISGAIDILAEKFSENATLRKKLRDYYQRNAELRSKVIKSKIEEAEKFKDYFDHTSLLNKIPSHRLLAILRGEKEGFLRVYAEPDETNAIRFIEDFYVKGKNRSSEIVSKACKESYDRLIRPSLETECLREAKMKADENAILVFAENLKQLLLQAPLGGKRILAIDPGYRTGCKVVCLDEQGNLLNNITIYPHAPQKETTEAIKKISHLVETYKIEAIAIGNATAGRETEHFIQKIKFKEKVKVFVVNEAGASIYSASPIAREEFPQHDVTVRGAVSIGRRLMDPLAELVKIEPKSIGVGQYQHDVDQDSLKNKLDFVVESCVNHVGVSLNTASKYLLTYVSGLGPQLAKNIVDHRKENGIFKLREELKKVPRLGEKAYEQCAGFLRIEESENPLDNSAVHPESYPTVERIAKKLKCKVSELIGNSEIIQKVNVEDFRDEKTGSETLNDILKELAKPTRDPRKHAKVFEFSDEVHAMEDLKLGMILPGIVTNITNFGAFVDVGVKQDGLVHISQLADRFVSNPLEVVQLHQHVKVKVIDLDIPRKRINLSIKEAETKNA
jgi:uncharacterized protein